MIFMWGFARGCFAEGCAAGTALLFRYGACPPCRLNEMGSRVAHARRWDRTQVLGLVALASSGQSVLEVKVRMELVGGGLKMAIAAIQGATGSRFLARQPHSKKRSGWCYGHRCATAAVSSPSHAHRYAPCASFPKRHTLAIDPWPRCGGLAYGAHGLRKLCT